MNYNRVLVLSPHTDDGELGCGGAISRWLEEGKDIYYVAFSTCEKNVPNHLPKDILERECRRSLKRLGIPTNNTTILHFDVRTFPNVRQEILDTMIELKHDISPELVLTPASSDTHQDHQVVHAETIRAFKKEASIWGYEHPWNNITAAFTLFIKLEEKHLDKKIEALKCYESQAEKAYFDEKYTRAHSYTRGMQVGCQTAEAFEPVRTLV